MIVVRWSGVVSAVCLAGVEHMVAVIGCCWSAMIVSFTTRNKRVLPRFLSISVYSEGIDLSVKSMPNALAT